MTAPGFDADVAIVGYGPVGQALAAMLGRAGHRVVVFERFQEIYRMPRAVHLDHEIMRLLSRSDWPMCWPRRWFRSATTSGSGPTASCCCGST